MFPSSGYDSGHDSGSSYGSGSDDAPLDYGQPWLSAPTSAGSCDSDRSDDGYGGLGDTSGGAFDPHAALRGLMDRVRLPMDDFPSDDFGDAGNQQPLPPMRTRHAFDDLLDVPSQRPDGLHRSIESPAALYMPQSSFLSDGAGRPQPDYQPDYFLDPVAAELAALHPHDEATPRAHYGWKGKDRAPAPGWHDFAPSIDPVYAAPSFMPDDRHGFGQRSPFEPDRHRGYDDRHGPPGDFDDPQRRHRVGLDPPMPPEDYRRDALAEVRQIVLARSAHPCSSISSDSARTWRTASACANGRRD